MLYYTYKQTYFLSLVHLLRIQNVMFKYASVFFLCIYAFCCCRWSFEKVSLCTLGWSGTSGSPASASVLGLQECT